MDDQETMKPGDRAFLLFLIVMAWGLTILFAVAAFVWPHGLIDVAGAFGAILYVLFIALIAGLLITFGSLAGRNPELGPAERKVWLVAFFLAGPVAFPAYWFAYLAKGTRAGHRGVAG